MDSHLAISSRVSGAEGNRLSPAVWTAGLLADLRYAARQLRRNKGITFATLVTLMLGIGATTAIFSLVYSLMLRPLPFPESSRIVELFDTARKAGLNKMPSNVIQYLDYSRNATSYETLALWSPEQGMLGEAGSAERVWNAAFTAELFDLLRVKPLLGRFFTKANDRPGEDDVAVLTQSFWESHFGTDPAVVGKSLRYEGKTYRIIGVAPRAMSAFDAQMDFFRPLSWVPQQENPGGRYSLYIYLFGRLKPGVTLAQANAEAAVIEKRYADAAEPQMKAFIDRSGVRVEVGAFQAERVQPVRSMLLLLQGGVAFVLLIGCVNVANLLLVRSNSRQSELAIRSALGAGRGLIARQLILESLLLTVSGAVAGIGVAWGALRLFNVHMRHILPQALPSTIDWRVLGFAVVVTLLVGVLIGLVPVFHVLRTNLAEVIQRGTRSVSSGRSVRALSGLLVVVQTAVALMLLTGAGLLIHSFAKALQVDPGLDPHGIVVGRIALPLAHRESDQAAKGVRDRLQRAFEAIPGVDSVASSGSTPLLGGIGINALTLENDPLPPGSPQPGAWTVEASPTYFATLRMRLLEGRFLEKADEAFGGKRLVVDESFAKKFFPHGSAIGGHISFGGRQSKVEDWDVIVGVVHDVPQNGVEDHSGNPFVYLLPQGRPGGMTWLLRTARPLNDVVPAMREAVRSVDPAIALYETSALDHEVGGSFDSRRAVMLLLGVFAAIALFLAALGIYGVLAYEVSERTREIGIRGALGATRGEIVAMVLRQGLQRTVIGLAAGLIFAALLSRSMTSLLFEVKPADPIVYLAVSVVLLLVAALASYLPARRAARIDPIVALRCE